MFGPVAEKEETTTEPNYDLEAYKLLADMYKQEDSIFWTRNQMFLLLNSALITILLGIFGLQSKSSSPAATIVRFTSRTTSGAPCAAPAATYEGTIQPSARDTKTIGLKVPLMFICGLGVFLCIVWMLIVQRAQGINDHLVVHMKYLEENGLQKKITNMGWFDTLLTRTTKDKRRAPRFLPDTHEVDGLKDVKDANGNPDTRRLPRCGSFMRIYFAWTFIAGLFVVLWTGVGFWIGFQWA